jgi:hypothetical protein
MRSRFLTGFFAAFIAVIAVPPTPTFAASNVSKVTKDSPLMTTPRPLFFNDLVAFDTDTHRTLALPAQRKGFAFAAGAPMLPLTYAEVGQALHIYPIAFIPDGETLALVALSGLPIEGAKRNLFIDAWGEWRPNTYIPAYVRGYPFIALRPSEAAEPILAFDPQALDFKADGGQPLITADGQPSEQLKGIMAFQAEYRQLAERTTVMTKALKEAGVLEEGNLQLQTPDNKEAQKIGGFLIVSEQKLKALPTDVLKKLMDADALGLAYAQLFSMGSLPNLFATQGASPNPEPAKPKARRSSKKGS